MPERKNIKTFPSLGVQGDDSWVKVSRLTIKEARRIDKVKNDPEVDAWEEVNRIYSEHIVGWNWVDDGGEPLPLPRDDPGVLDRLTDEEFLFLSECLKGSETERKNSPAGS